MRTHFLLSLLLLTSTSALFSNSVSVADAQQVAGNYFKAKNTVQPSHIVQAANLVYTNVGSDGVATFYVFDMHPAKGFVIVAADDRIKPVLGYSTESNFGLDFQLSDLAQGVYLVELSVGEKVAIKKLIISR